LEKADESEPIWYDEETRRYIRMYATNVQWNNYGDKRVKTEVG
jgi:hypothetical protein